MWDTEIQDGNYQTRKVLIIGHTGRSGMQRVEACGSRWYYLEPIA